MCGIFGFYGFEDKDLLLKMSNILKHRGPDDRGVFLDDSIGLGNVRLSIIDIEGGKQPIFNEDGSIVVVYNGEICNFRELRTELEKRGHRFYTNTDTEVIVHAYEEWGFDSVLKFNGMFAFALWDLNKGLLFLGRDRSGIKPLYYTIRNRKFLFSSEIKALLLYPEVKRELDLQAFHHFVNLRYVPKEYTLIRGVKKLLAGHYMIVSDEGIKIAMYWKPTINVKNLPEEYFVKTLLRILKNAVKRHLISDVSIGVYLSSGLDSSTIVAVASQVSEKPVKTFTLVFGDPQDEHLDSRKIAEEFETDHKEVHIDEYKVLREYPKMIWYADMPKRNLYPYYLAKGVRKHVKVVLSGLGGDELFGGYDWKYQYAINVEKFRQSLSENNLNKLKDYAREIVKALSSYGSLEDIELINRLKKVLYIDNKADQYLAISSLDEVFVEDYLNNIYGNKLKKCELKPVREIFKEYFRGNENFVDQVLLSDYSIKLVDDFLHVEDTMSMSNSLESRVPFLDNELVEFAFTIPSHLKFNQQTNKYILKKAMIGILPREVINREKRGFGVNVYARFKGEIREYAEQILPEGNAVRLGLIKKDYIDKVLKTYPQPEMAKHYTLIWNLITFEIWYELFINSEKIEKPKFSIDNYTG